MDHIFDPTVYAKLAWLLVCDDVVFVFLVLEHFVWFIWWGEHRRTNWWGWCSLGSENVWIYTEWCQFAKWFFICNALFCCFKGWKKTSTDFVSYNLVLHCIFAPNYSSSFNALLAFILLLPNTSMALSSAILLILIKRWNVASHLVNYWYCCLFIHSK